MLDKARNNPFVTSLVVLLIYLIWFLLSPTILAPFASDTPPEGLDSLAAELPNQIALIIILTVIVAILQWWKPVGFTRQEKKSLRYIWPPLIYTFLYLIAGIFYGTQIDSGFFGASNVTKFIIALLTAFMVGYTEETMFRGILFFGMGSKYKAFWGTIISAVIFGLFHFINLIHGQEFGITVNQVIHAGSVGIMYAALRLMTGSLWPVMLLHGFWDFSVILAPATISAATQGSGVAQALAPAQTSGFSVSPIQFAPALLYGAFVLWRWTKRQKDTTVSETA